jgi:phosphonate transport system substrate-binding protein
MHCSRLLIVVCIMLLTIASATCAADLSWPKELTFALLSTESAPEVGRRWTSDLFSPEGIASKTFTFNDPHSTSGYLVPLTFFLMEMRIEPKEHFSKLSFSDSHEASILAVAHKKVHVASTNVPDVQQMAREGKIPRAAVRVIWVSQLIPNDPIVIRKDLPDSLQQVIQQSLITVKAKHPATFVGGGTWSGGFVKVDDAMDQIIRDLNETAKRLAALK